MLDVLWREAVRLRLGLRDEDIGGRNTSQTRQLQRRRDDGVHDICFGGHFAFNQDAGAASFNGTPLKRWLICSPNATMEYMFMFSSRMQASAFNQDLGWCVDDDVSLEHLGMFDGLRHTALTTTLQCPTSRRPAGCCRHLRADARAHHDAHPDAPRRSTRSSLLTASDAAAGDLRQVRGHRRQHHRDWGLRCWIEVRPTYSERPTAAPRMSR